MQNILNLWLVLTACAQIQNIFISRGAMRIVLDFNSLDQNLLHFLQVLRSDQNPLDLIGFPVIGS
jgi:hypothetical protein